MWLSLLLCFGPSFREYRRVLATADGLVKICRGRQVADRDAYKWNLEVSSQHFFNRLVMNKRIQSKYGD